MRDKSGTNWPTERHNMLWPDSDYRQETFSHLLSQHPLLHYEVNIASHRELHQQLTEPGVMTKNLARKSLGFLATYMDLPNDNTKLGNYIHWLGHLGTSERDLEANHYYEHLSEQREHVRPRPDRGGF